MKKFAFAVAMLASVSAVPAMAQSFSGGTGTFNGLGSNPGDVFDQVVVGSLAGNYTGVGTYDLNSITFTAGTTFAGSGTFTGSLGGLTGTFGGQTFNYAVNYSLNVGTDTDTITLGGNRFDVQGTSVYIRPLTLSGTFANPVSIGNLQVTTGAVPEPASWAMMILGMGAVGAGLRSRKSAVKARIAFA